MPTVVVMLVIYSVLVLMIMIVSVVVLMIMIVHCAPRICQWLKLC